MSQMGIQVCFCGPDSTALPAEPLDAHDHFCLIWDWAMANRKISPQERLAQLEGTQRDLGITDEEIAAEEVNYRTFWPFREAVGHMLGASPVSPLYRRPEPLQVKECYRARAGFMVHVKPGCRCPK